MIQKEALRAHARRELARNVILKFTLLLISALAIGSIVLLDRLKAHHHDIKGKPYTHATLTAHLKNGDPVLADALTRVPATSSFATTEEAFNAIADRTPAEAARVAEEKRIRTQYGAPLQEANATLGELLKANPRKPDAIREQFNARTNLIALRAADLQEAQQTAAEARAELKRAWDASNPSKARVPYAYFHVPALDTAARHIVDPDDPLSIIYDALWYAALIIGVLTFAALVLAPLFRAVPLTGADDSFGEKLRGLLARAPRAMRTGAGLIASTIGAVAIVGASAALPSSPLKETGFVPPREDVQEIRKVKEPEEPKPPVTATDTTGGPSTPDSEIEKLRTELTEIRNTISQHDAVNHIDAAHVHEAPPPDDRSLIRMTELAENVERSVGGLTEQISQRDEAIGRKIADSHATVIDKVAAVEKRTQNVEQELQGAGLKIDTRANDIESSVILPHMLGEKPSLLSTTLGFDRYQVTPTATAFLKKLGAPEEVLNAVGLLGDARYSNDELRLALRAQLCTPPSRNCDIYLAWRNSVLRATRTR